MNTRFQSDPHRDYDPGDLRSKASRWIRDWAIIGLAPKGTDTIDVDRVAEPGTRVETLRPESWGWFDTDQRWRAGAGVYLEFLTDGGTREIELVNTKGRGVLRAPEGFELADDDAVKHTGYPSSPFGRGPEFTPFQFRCRAPYPTGVSGGTATATALSGMVGDPLDPVSFPSVYPCGWYGSKDTGGAIEARRGNQLLETDYSASPGQSGGPIWLGDSPDPTTTSARLRLAATRNLAPPPVSLPSLLGPMVIGIVVATSGNKDDRGRGYTAAIGWEKVREITT